MSISKLEIPEEIVHFLKALSNGGSETLVIMDINREQQEGEDDEHLWGIRKITYWEKYGVKSFPYRGSRKYTPLVYQSDDGGMMISNDVFGLTIRQFERKFMDCLDKRKSQEQWILNLRYPDKSSNEYLDFLQNCTDHNTNPFPTLGNYSEEKLLYEHLVNAVGTEIQIRNRQRVFIIQEMINGVVPSDIQVTTSGSLAEGLDLPGSDIDKMYIINGVHVIQNVRNIKSQFLTLVMVTDNDHPGFTRLKLIEVGTLNSIYIKPLCFELTFDSVYLTVNGFLENIQQQHSHLKLSTHGPCLSTIEQYVDIAVCLRSKHLPDNALPWVWRSRRQWPSNFVIQRIKEYGCLVVPIGPKTILDNSFLWRLSFSMAEKLLVHSFNYTQILCYGLLKLTLKHNINSNAAVKDLLCSYFLKTALFWVSEEVDINKFQLSKIYYCFSLCLDKLILWVNNCYCPNYFIPEHNMFIGKINTINNQKLLHILISIRFGGIISLIQHIFPSDRCYYLLFNRQIEQSFIMLDFIFFKINTIITVTQLSFCYDIRNFIASLLTSESSAFINGVCRYYYAIINQYSAQLLPPLTGMAKTYSIYKQYHRHLQDGIKTDSVSGWLLYASFYYVTGHYNITLKLIDYVLSKCTPAMAYINRYNYHEGQMNNYRSQTHAAMSLNEKMKIATVCSVRYLKNSSLIPEELKMEVEENDLTIPSIVLSHCLKFLCYHHIGEHFKRQQEQALCDLYRSVKSMYFVTVAEISETLTILGICFEIAGDKNNAYHCYSDAMKNGYKVCLTAEKRKLKLGDI